MHTNKGVEMVSRVGLGNATALATPPNQRNSHLASVQGVHRMPLIGTQTVQAVSVMLTYGFTAIVDAADEELVSAYRWRVYFGHGTVYAKNIHNLAMHRLIMNAAPGEIIDHRDGNGLNNTRENLRICLVRENSRNQKLHRENRAGFKGIYQYGRGYRAQISVDRRKHNLGNYATAEAAALAYDQAAIRLHGEFARLNFPDLITHPKSASVGGAA